jgi:hypothetical protein
MSNEGLPGKFTAPGTIPRSDEGEQEGTASLVSGAPEASRARPAQNNSARLCV